MNADAVLLSKMHPLSTTNPSSLDTGGHTYGPSAPVRPTLSRDPSATSNAHLLPQAGRQPPTTSKRLHLNRWHKEALSSVTAIGAMIITFSVLSRFDRRPRSDWQLAIFLNALVSVFAIMLQASLLFPIEECPLLPLSQFRQGTCL